MLFRHSLRNNKIMSSGCALFVQFTQQEHRTRRVRPIMAWLPITVVIIVVVFVVLVIVDVVLLCRLCWRRRRSCASLFTFRLPLSPCSRASLCVYKRTQTILYIFLYRITSPCPATDRVFQTKRARKIGKSVSTIRLVGEKPVQCFCICSEK